MNVSIIEVIKGIHPLHRLENDDVSSHTKSAQTITKEWQNAVRNSLVGTEVSVSPENNEKIDVVDFNSLTAYELKVSGKNAHHEFFKDIAKVLTFNTYKNRDNQLRKLVFISEEIGIQSLNKRLDKRFIKLLKDKHNLVIDLVIV